jgi:hypothetical protein
MVSLYFAGCAALAVVLWGAVHVLEGPKSAIELPASKLTESTVSDINAASLMGVHETDWNAYAIAKAAENAEASARGQLSVVALDAPKSPKKKAIV